MRFLDLPPWANCSKGLEFTGILLTSFFFVRKHRDQMSESPTFFLHELIALNFNEFFAAFSETRANRSTNFLEWQKSESLKEFWWDFLTRLLEQTALRGLNSPASFWLLSFSFVNIDNKWANCSYLNETSWFDKILMRFLDSPPWTNRSKGLEFTGIF